jgi:4-hydroxy-tetrahydrodipicolinate synthase
MHGLRGATGSSLRGVIPAHLLPFDARFEIDQPNLRRHLRALLEIDGISAITTNGHASEVPTLTADEQRLMLEIALQEAAGEVPVISGVYADGSAKAARIAGQMQAAGADALLVFPSQVFNFGGERRPEVAFAHYATIAEATSLPMIAFVYPVASGLSIGTDTLLRICGEIENVVAIKEWTNDIVLYERNYRALKSLDKDISILSSFSRSLFASLCIGADGILSGHGSLVAELHVELWRAIQRADLDAARRCWSRIQPIAEVCYADPLLDGHNRMKEALAILGRIDEAHMRPPLQPIPDHERAQLSAAVEAAGLKRESRVYSLERLPHW